MSSLASDLPSKSPRSFNLVLPDSLPSFHLRSVREWLRRGVEFLQRGVLGVGGYALREASVRRWFLWVGSGPREVVRFAETSQDDEEEGQGGPGGPGGGGSAFSHEVVEVIYVEKPLIYYRPMDPTHYIPASFLNDTSVECVHYWRNLLPGLTKIQSGRMKR